MKRAARLWRLSGWVAVTLFAVLFYQVVFRGFGGPDWAMLLPIYALAALARAAELDP